MMIFYIVVVYVETIMTDFFSSVNSLLKYCIEFFSNLFIMLENKSYRSALIFEWERDEWVCLCKISYFQGLLMIAIVLYYWFWNKFLNYTENQDEGVKILKANIKKEL